MPLNFFSTSTHPSPDGKSIISGSSDKIIKIWDLSSGQLTRTLAGHEGWVNGVALSPDGKHIASGSSSKTKNMGTFLETTISKKNQSYKTLIYKRNLNFPTYQFSFPNGHYQSIYSLIS